MRRFSKFLLQALLIAAAAAIAALIVDKTAVPGAVGISNGIMAVGAGLVLGLLVAWLRGLEWAHMPARLRLWRKTFAVQCAWSALGCASLAVIVYY